MLTVNFFQLSGSFRDDVYQSLTIKLRDAGYDVNSRDNQGNIHSLAIKLLGVGYDVNSRDSKGNTPLHCAAKAGRLPEVKALIRCGADINALSNGRKGEAPLHCAAKAGRLRVVELLIRRGADINALSRVGESPLHVAAWYNNLSVVDVLIRSGADVNIPNDVHQTPLYYAAQLGRLRIIKALIIDGKANINAQTPSGFTPLHHAVQGNKPSASRILVELGADTTLAAGSYRAIDYLCKAAEAIKQALDQRQRKIEDEKIRNAHRVNIFIDSNPKFLDVSPKIFEYLAGQGQSEFFIRKNHERHLK